MKKVLLTSYTSTPASNIGGGNKVIYNLLKSNEQNIVNYSYLSKHLEYNFEKINDDISLNNEILKREKISQKLFRNSGIYRKITTNPIYLLNHYKMTDLYFKEKAKKYFNDHIIHSHDVLSFSHFAEIKQKKILTIHSKGSIKSDLNDYYRSKFLHNKINSLDKKETYLLDAADLITFPSKSALNLFCDQKKLEPSQKYCVIYNGIDFAQIDNIKCDSKYLNLKNNYDIILLNVSEHIKIKNIDTLILVVNVLKREYKIRPLLINVGKGPETERLRRLVTSLQIENEVNFIRYLNNEEIIGLMKICDFYLMASERVIFDYVILEAMASHATVIAKADGGNQEIIQNGNNGYLFKDLDSREIAHLVMSASPDIKCNIKKSIMHYSIENMFQNYLNSYGD